MMSLELRGVRVHNLKGVDVAFPLGRLTLVTGVSGSGKSSLIFDTLHAEAQRRYLQSFSIASRQLLERFDQPDADWIGDLPPAIAVRTIDSWGSAIVLADATELGELLAELFAREGIAVCPSCHQNVRPHSTADVIAELHRLPAGARVSLGFPDQPGEGESSVQWSDRLREEGWIRVQIGSNIRRLDEKAPIEGPDGAIVLIDRVETGKVTDERLSESIETGFRRGDGRMVAILESGEIRFDRRWRCPQCNVSVATPEVRLFDAHHPLGACADCAGTGKIKGATCSRCGGHRFNEQALSVRWRGRSIADMFALSLVELAPVVSESSRAMAACVAALVDLGLGHLSPDRFLETLATGESQRLRLHRAFAADLNDALYLFDEPTTGLHPADLAAILPKFLALRDAGNTVVIVDHHPMLRPLADYHIELGPGAGEEGGTIVSQGPLVDDDSPLELSSTRARSHGTLKLRMQTPTPLEVDFPLGVLCVVAGISGAGKTRLLRDALVPTAAHAKQKKGYEAAPLGVTLTGANQIDDVILFDQTPLSRSSRSNAATALKIFDEIRDVFAATTDAKIRNFDPGAFSFNQPGGRCETCEGQGSLAVDMQFLPDVRATCPECLGRRYRKEILAIKVRGLNISEVLDLTAREAFRFFRTQRSLEKKLKWLLDLGLDYLRLGQPLETLSLGEAQRLKLAAHLATSRKPRSLFVLIEPTRGLHPDDVQDMLACLGNLLATGHSVIVEDQNPIILRSADYLIELGPIPGAGRILATGPPAEIARLDTPTGKFLQRLNGSETS